MPPILSTSHCEFYGARLCAHAQKTIPLAPIHSFTKQIVPRIVDLKSFDIHDTSFPYAPYKLLPFIKNILGAHRFFSFFLLSFIFITHFSWACVTPWHESRNLYLKHSFSTYTCLSNNSLISAWISTKFVSTLSYVCSTR